MDKVLIKKKFSIFPLDSKDTFIDVYFKDENIWLPQKLMAKLFEVDSDSISYHLKNIYFDGELNKQSTTEEISVVQKEGNRKVKRTVLFYNLDAIISVGYRINSKRATKFRIWATKNLKEYILKGYVLDDDRLKQGRDLNKNYFKELLERIRSIRSSERRIYQQITDIFSECSTDYDKNSQITKDFFSTIQNKFHYAISGKTAAEIIYENVNNKRKNMGLKIWKKSPNNRILKSDILIAKNYLNEAQIKQLERTITGFFDYLERIIEKRISFTMREFIGSVNRFLSFNEYKVLHNRGIISMQDAKKKASKEYDLFNKTQITESDFDKDIKKHLKIIKSEDFT